MKKIGVCGHFNTNSEAIGGQTIKTRIICETLEKIYGSDQVLKLDTKNWRANKIMFLFSCINMARHSKNIIILPAQNGVKVLIPLFVFLSKILGKKLHYVIVGAWLPNLLEKNKYLIKPTKSIHYIYAQTKTLNTKLSELGIVSNTFVMPNFKKIQPVSIDLEKNKYEKPYRLCMVSRINYEKGIETAISVVERLNKERDENIVELDIYGPIQDDYKERFSQLLKKHDSIKYNGIINYNETIEVIKEYYLLLFPTKYYTEGFPGTILDAYLSGVPVLASRWESSQDIIKEDVTGCTFEFDDDDDFYRKLKYLLKNKDLVIEMKKNCIIEATKYSADNAINILVKNIS